MFQDHHSAKVWIRNGIVCGFLVSLIYPALIFIPMPFTLSVFLVCLFGPLLSLASAGLYVFLRLHRKTITAFIGVISNIIAGVLITTMLLIQQAIRYSKPDSIENTLNWIWRSINQVHLGLDVSWDAYIFIGTLCFAFSMFSHPKLGKLFSIAGVIISVTMILFNVLTFPIPPGDAGLFDLGPLVGLWYLIVTIKILLSYSWINKQFTEAVHE